MSSSAEFAFSLYARSYGFTSYPIYFILISENVHILSVTGNTETQTKTGGISHMRGRNFSHLRTDRLVHGNSVHLRRLPRKTRRPSDRSDLPVDVPHLRYGCLYRSGLCKNQKAAGTSARQHLPVGIFFIRVLKRVSLKAASFLPLGLQQRQGKCQRADPAGLCPVLAARVCSLSAFSCTQTGSHSQTAHGALSRHAFLRPVKAAAFPTDPHRLQCLHRCPACLTCVS